MTSPDLFEIVEAHADAKTLPIPSAPYYVVDREGFFVHKNTKLGRVLIRTDKPPKNLPKYDFSAFLWPDVPKIPAEILSQAWGFFHAAYESLNAEAAVLLLLDSENNYSIFVPPQEVDYTSVDYKYDPATLPPDHHLVGTIHSHCDFSAFHSGTDETDASKHDGLHLTFGRIDGDQPEIDVMISFGGLHWTDYELKDVSDATTLERLPAPSEWLAQVTVAPLFTAPAIKTKTNGNGNYIHSSFLGIGIFGDDSDYKPYGSDKEKSYYDLMKHRPASRTQKYAPNPWIPDRAYDTDPDIAIDQLEFDIELLVGYAADRGIDLIYYLSSDKAIPVPDNTDLDVLLLNG